MTRFSRWLDDINGRGFYNRARKHRDEGRLELAAPDFAEAEKYFNEVYGPDHQWTVTAGSQWAWCMLRLGNNEAGIAALQDYLRREVDARGRETNLAQSLEQMLSEWRRYLASVEDDAAREAQLIPSPRQWTPITLVSPGDQGPSRGPSVVDLAISAGSKADPATVWAVRGVAIEAAIWQWVRII